MHQSSEWKRYLIAAPCFRYHQSPIVQHCSTIHSFTHPSIYSFNQQILSSLTTCQVLCWTVSSGGPGSLFPEPYPLCYLVIPCTHLHGLSVVSPISTDHSGICTLPFSLSKALYIQQHFIAPYKKLLRKQSLLLIPLYKVQFVLFQSNFSIKVSLRELPPQQEAASTRTGRTQPRGSHPLGCDMLVFCRQPGVTSNQTLALNYQSLQVAYFQKMNLVGFKVNLIKKPAPTCIHCLQKCKEEGQSWVLGTVSTGSLCHSPGGDVVRNDDLSKVPQCQNQHQNQALIPQSRLYFQLRESLSPLGTSIMHSRVSPVTWFQQVGPGPNQVSMSPLTLSAHTSRKAACSTNNCCQGLPVAPKLFTATHT